MKSLPESFFIVMIAVTSALAGGLVTWIIMQAASTGPAQSRRQSGEVTSEDLLRVERAKGGPVVVVDGQRLRDLRQIKDRETGEETIAAIKAVLDFAEGWLPISHDQQIPASPSSARSVRREASSFSLTTRRTTSLPSTKRGSPPWSGRLELVEEIDALLQERLAERPELAGQGVHLGRDIDGRLLIYVGQHRYPSTDEIPNDDVGAFIQCTIEMWENR